MTLAMPVTGDSDASGNPYAPLFAVVAGFPPPAHPLGSSTVSALSDKRLLFLTGKGGVGKSTVAIALGIAAARRGMRTIVAELGGQDRAAVAFGHADGSGAARELRLAPELHTTSIDPQHAMEEYLQQK